MSQAFETTASFKSSMEAKTLNIGWTEQPSLEAILKFNLDSVNVKIYGRKIYDNKKNYYTNYPDSIWSRKRMQSFLHGRCPLHFIYCYNEKCSL